MAEAFAHPSDFAVVIFTIPGVADLAAPEDRILHSALIGAEIIPVFDRAGNSAYHKYSIISEPGGRGAAGRPGEVNHDPSKTPEKASGFHTGRY